MMENKNQFKLLFFPTQGPPQGPNVGPTGIQTPTSPPPPAQKKKRVSGGGAKLKTKKTKQRARVIAPFVFLGIHLACLFTHRPSQASVNVREASYSHTWTDLSLKSDGQLWELKRTYSSRSLHNGVFGFGWCADFESALLPNPDGSLRLRECGTGPELIFVPDNGSSPRSQGHSKTYRAINSEGERITEKIRFPRRHFRVKSDGTKEDYDELGRLVERESAKGLRAHYLYDSGGRLTRISLPKIDIKLSYSSKKTRRIEASGHPPLEYSYREDDLIRMQSEDLQMNYVYDDLHNMIWRQGPSGESEALSYDRIKDQVVSLQKSDGCRDEFEYEELRELKPQVRGMASVRGPTQKTKWKRLCYGRLVESKTYQFFFQILGSKRSLVRTEVESATELTDSNYHPETGRVLSVTKRTRKDLK